MATYNTKKAIRAATNKDNYLEGVVEVPFYLGEGNIEDYNETMTNELLGEDYGYLLTDLSYTLVGCNTEKQTLFIKISGSTTLLFEEWES